MEQVQPPSMPSPDDRSGKIGGDSSNGVTTMTPFVNVGQVSPATGNQPPTPIKK